jgi:16S rRNA (cytosine967-C5)-methyltransferase
MSIFFAHLNQSVRLIEQYNGQTPLTVYLKQFFQQEKKYGSKDRKTIAALCYQYYRCAFLVAEKELNLEEAVIKAHILCITEQSKLSKAVKPEWAEYASKSFEEKCTFFNIKKQQLFPWQKLVSPKIDAKAWNKHFLQQPKVYARIRKNSTETIKRSLNQSQLTYELDGQCLAVESATKLQDIGIINKELVIQDATSQATSIAFSKFLVGDSIWDCCAASGGKALYLTEYFPKAKITATDIRESILQNLQTRFKEAQLPIPKLKMVDLSKPVHFNNKFLNIVADVPCSGSGTWARTPEAMHHFTEGKLQSFQKLQRNIVDNSLKNLATNGIFVYITCSVFKAENEDNVQYLLENHNLQLIESAYQKGYDTQADTMFWAVFRSK